MPVLGSTRRPESIAAVRFSIAIVVVDVMRCFCFAKTFLSFSDYVVDLLLMRETHNLIHSSLSLQRDFASSWSLALRGVALNINI